MERIEFILYVIVLGLVINLGADMIWKYMPGRNIKIDKIVSFILILICALLVFFYKSEQSMSAQIKQSTQGYQSPAVAGVKGNVIITNDQTIRE